MTDQKLYFDQERPSFSVTTAVKTRLELIERAQDLAKSFHMPFIQRKKATINQLLSKHGDLLVLYADKLVYYPCTGEEIYFHPNTAMVRMKNPEDPLGILVGSGKSVLDCTLGLAGDSLVMAAKGNEVLALEKNPIIALITSYGLQHYQGEGGAVQEAISGIEVVQAEALTYLKTCADQSFDIVYLDPMFVEKIPESQNLAGLQALEQFVPWDKTLLDQAKRVAKEKVIIKAHYKDTVFEDFGFVRQVRKHAKFHYGYWLADET